MITRRRVLACAGTLAASRLHAQPQAPIHFREYARCLPDYLASLADDAYTRRNARIARLNTPAAIRDYQAWARRTFQQLAGALPERTPLNLRTVGAFERDRYRVEKIVYQSRPGLFVTANLYLPKTGTPPYPGVLFQMGHSNNGKSYALYQRCCQGLVQLGHVVLGVRPHRAGRAHLLPAAERLAHAPALRHRGAQRSRTADAAGGRNRDGRIALGCHAQPGCAGRASASRPKPAGIDGTIRRRHPHHDSGRHGRSSRGGRREFRQHGELRPQPVPRARLVRRRRAGSDRLRPAGLRPVGHAVAVRAEAPAGVGERSRFLRHLFAVLRAQRAGGVRQTRARLRRAGRRGSHTVRGIAAAARAVLSDASGGVQLVRAIPAPSRSPHRRRAAHQPGDRRDPLVRRHGQRRARFRRPGAVRPGPRAGARHSNARTSRRTFARCSAWTRTSRRRAWKCAPR